MVLHLRFRLKGNVVYGPFVTTGTATEILGLLPDVEYILREVKLLQDLSLLRMLSLH